MGFTTEAWNEFVTNNFYDLTKPEITEIKTNLTLKDIVPNIILTQIFQNKFNAKKYSLLLSLIRKIKIILSEYNSLARRLKRFDSKHSNFNSYFEIINKAEMTILYCGQVIDLMKIIKGTNLFDKNDDSIYERIYSLQNKIKHVSNELEIQKQLQVLKFDNWGIYTTDKRIEYFELRTFVKSLVIFLKNITTLKKQ